MLWIIITWLVFGCFCSDGAEEGQYGLSVRNGVLVRDGKPYRGIGVNLERKTSWPNRQPRNSKTLLLWLKREKCRLYSLISDSGFMKSW